MGLNFADKKEGRRLPAGLVPLADPFPEGDLPEVEIIVGDTTKFGNTKSSKPESEPVIEKNSDLYEPKVSTWGVFPRPNNISKTVGQLLAELCFNRIWLYLMSLSLLLLVLYLID